MQRRAPLGRARRIDLQRNPHVRSRELRARKGCRIESRLQNSDDDIRAAVQLQRLSNRSSALKTAGPQPVADDDDSRRARAPFGLGKRATHLVAGAEQLEKPGGHFAGEDRLEAVASGEGHIRKPEGCNARER
jgi:hypothetical protein